MSRPFDFIEGKKVDLNNQQHRDVIIQRNKELQKAIDEGISIFETNNLKVKIISRVEITCYVCGSHIEEDDVNDLDDVYNSYPDKYLPKLLKCNCCKAKYSYHSHSDSYYVIPNKETKK